MKRIIAMILILMMFSPFGLAVERQMPLEKAKKSDEGVYRFLEILLNYAVSSTNAIVDERNTSADYNNLLGLRLNQTMEEIEFYKVRGITSPVENYIHPFLDLHDGLDEIILGQMLFLENINGAKEKDRRAYLLALKGVEIGKEGILKADRSVHAISNFTFVDEDQNELRLNTERLEENLERIQKMFQSYEGMLKKYEVPEAGLTLHASNLNPPLFENVTFYGYAGGVEKIQLHIKNPEGLELIIPLSVSGGMFRFVYNFEKTGRYEVFAIGERESKILKSNTLILNVTKIPTEIIVQDGRAYVGESLELKGILQDYKGNSLGGQTVFIIFKNSSIGAVTNNAGAFVANLTSEEAGEYNATIYYPGDSIHARAVSRIKVAFLKHPLIIKLSSKEKVKVGKPLKIEGIVESKYEVPVTIYVNGRIYKNMSVKDGFKFSIVPNETGIYHIQAVFRGDSFYAPSKSNILMVDVVEGFPILRVALLLILSVGIFLVYKLIPTRQTTEGMSDEDFLELLKAEEEKNNRKKRNRRLNDYYRVLYSRLIGDYGLKRSTTPRELLSYVRDESFAGDLALATILHEKYTYAKKKLTPDEIIGFIKSVARALLGFLVRDEL